LRIQEPLSRGDECSAEPSQLRTLIVGGARCFLLSFTVYLIVVKAAGGDLFL
jgi:hypothetical protein